MIISMKRYALLRLENDTNKVVFDCHASDLASAVKTFQTQLPSVTLDKYGYAKFGDVSFCVAEYWELFCTL